MQSLRLVVQAAACTLALSQASAAFGQGMQRPLTRQSDPANSPDYRSVAVSMPLNLMEKQSVGRIEFNLQGKATLAVEGSMVGDHQELSPKDQQEDGNESEMMQAKEAALMISRYSQPAAMAGFFWTLGVGYRQQQVKWQVHPGADDKQINEALVDSSTQMLNHDAVMSGVTGHARAGYRYVGEEFPIVAGAFLGIRHYQAGVQDASSLSGAGATSVAYAPMTDMEKGKLVRQYETAPELGLEIGLAF